MGSFWTQLLNAHQAGSSGSIEQFIPSFHLSHLRFHVPEGTSHSSPWNMTPENAMFQKEHSVAGRGTCQWNPLFRKSVHFLRPVGADFPPFQLRNDPAWYFATKLVSLYTPMTSHQAPSSEGPRGGFIFAPPHRRFCTTFRSFTLDYRLSDIAPGIHPSTGAAIRRSTDLRAGQRRALQVSGLPWVSVLARSPKRCAGAAIGQCSTAGRDPALGQQGYYRCVE